MKHQHEFRPLLDFERQIDDAFLRYSKKTKKTQKETKLGLKSRNVLKANRIVKFLSK